MLHIKYRTTPSDPYREAVWDAGDMTWNSTDDDFEALLNKLTRPEELFDFYTPYREGSYEQVVMDNLWPILEFELVKIKPTAPPAEHPDRTD